MVRNALNARNLTILHVYASPKREMIEKLLSCLALRVQIQAKKKSAVFWMTAQIVKRKKSADWKTRRLRKEKRKRNKKSPALTSITAKIKVKGMIT